MSVTPAKALCNPYKVEQHFFMVGCQQPEALNILHQHSDYCDTPLFNLSKLAEKIGVANLLVKDESARMGQNSFKPLGTLYAVFQTLAQYEKDISSLEKLVARVKDSGKHTFISAGDPALCRATAWAAAYFGQKARVFLPESTCQTQENALTALGAEVQKVKGSIDEILETACQEADKFNNFHIVQDGSSYGWEKSARYLVDGYYTLFMEAGEQIRKMEVPSPDVVIIQSGSGLLLEAAARYFSFFGNGKMPSLVCVEPVSSACMFESAAAPFGRAVHLESTEESTMTGLNCSCPSLSSWPIIRGTYDLFMAIDDIWTFQAMKCFHKAVEPDPLIQAGETGAAGLGALLALLIDPDLEDCKDCVSIDENSTVLIINTEGISDPALFEKVINNQLDLT